VLLLAAVVVAVVAAVVIGGGGDDDDTGTRAVTAPPAAATPAVTDSSAPPPKPREETIRIVGGQPRGGVHRLEYEKGDEVVLEVRSDTADEIHIHGYDLSKDVAAGGRVRFRFEAKIDGQFEIEMEHAGREIAALVINP
jgi:hypothetical protein